LRQLKFLLAGVGAALALTGCARAPAFRIVAGPEQRSLAPVVQHFCNARRVHCRIDYLSPVDIGRMLSADATPNADAVWPASGVWLGLSDTRHRLSESKPIVESPVVLGVRLDRVRALGWVGRPVGMGEIRAAAEQGRIGWLMPSGARSSVGVLAYLEMLSDLNAVDGGEAVRPMLAATLRTSGSAAWLRDLYLSTAKEGEGYPAIWTTEALLKETNDGLKAEHKPLLYAVYPKEGVAYAEAPLAFVERGRGAATRGFFRDLQAYLLSPEAQRRMARQGRRPVPKTPLGLPPQPEWNFDPRVTPRGMTLPPTPVIAQALDAYQGGLRRPSATAFCLDYSGSMRGPSQTALRAAMAGLLTPQTAAASLVQWTPQDRIVLLPYGDDVLSVTRGDGSAASQATLLAALDAETPRGGGDTFGCVRRALDELAPYAGKAWLPAVVVMTDGHAPGGADFEEYWRRNGHGIPVIAISYAKADKHQLAGLAGVTRGRLLEGEADLADAFRASRGYN
jgi:Ca-activated chloride channel family protein